LRPGETPIDDFSGLKIPNIYTLKELSFHEAINIANAIVDYFRQGDRKRPSFDIEGVKAIHRDMFCDAWEWAGRFRLKDIDSVPFASHFIHIQEHLHNLLEDVKVWDAGSADAIEQAGLLHHRAVQIHPFSNGNGRWSRMLTNVWLLERQQTLVEWPADFGEDSPIRKEYIDALKAADHGDLEPFIALHRRFTPMPARPVF
jgi:fido (protein-threonine AMPylation protein)